MRLIKNDLYLLLIGEEAEIEVGNLITDTYRVWEWKDNCSLLGRKLVIAYYPLTKEAKELDLPLLPNPFEDSVDIKELAENRYPTKNECALDIIEILREKQIVFIEGYKASQSDKQFSLEDMKKAIEMAREYEFIQSGGGDTESKYTEEEIIQSLSTQQLPKVFIPEIEQYTQNYHKDIWYNRIKTITNSEGKEELVGEYGY